MANRKLSLLFIAFFCLSWSLPNLISQSIQQDTSYNFPPVNVIASKIRQQNIGSISQDWTTAKLDQLFTKNVADLLSNDGGIYIKSYGLGSLATSSVRGASAGHTLVLWNGLPVHSPMLGLLDLSLLPTSFSESVNFTLGGNSALWGSGAIGGVLNMENEANFSRKLNLKSSTRIGSFGHVQQQLKFNVGNEKIQLVSKIDFQQADNDFFYFVADGLPDRQQTNAELRQQNIGQDLFWKINDRNQLAVHFWWQKSDREIPPTNVQNVSDAHQDDQSTRVLLNYKHIKNNGLWNFKTSLFDEHIDFFDDQTALASLSQVRTYLGEVTRQWNWRERHEFLIGNTQTHTQAWAAGYGDNSPKEYKTALFASWKYRTQKLETQFSLRQELINSSTTPLIPSFGFNYNIISTLFLKGKFSRNYRLPTFNDRFWLPGGNPDLQPESGWSQEMTLQYQVKKNNFSVNASLTTFNRNIDNWILWTIKEGQPFWSANNITKVWSRGLEPRLQLSRQVNKTTYQIRLGYNYIRSTNQVALVTPSIAQGEQLIYTPKHHAFGTFSVAIDNFYFAYQHAFNGTTKGINDSIDSYQIGNLQIQYNGVFKKINGTLFLNINNLWDANYFVIERRPMPGLHFNTGLNIIFNNK